MHSSLTFKTFASFSLIWAFVRVLMSGLMISTDYRRVSRECTYSLVSGQEGVFLEFTDVKDELRFCHLLNNNKLQILSTSSNSNSAKLF
jgi:hypothetical protein